MRPTLALSGPSSVAIQQTAQFSAAVTGAIESQIQWSVDGIPGGSSNVGTITSSGIYTPPGVASGHTVSASVVTIPSLVKSLEVEVLNPVPHISYAVVTSINNGIYQAQITGSGFISASTFTLGDAVSAFKVQSGTSATASFTPADGNVTSLPLTVINPPPGSASSSEYQLALPPSYKQLANCSNPNTGTAWGPWGSGPMLYEDLTFQTKLMVVEPSTSDSVFWSSQENGPGESVLLQGSFTSNAKNARLALISPGTGNWQSVVAGSSRVVPVTQITSTAVAFAVPSDMPSGVYGYQLEESGLPMVSGRVNVPQIDWIIGTPHAPTAETALAAHVIDCAAESGGDLRIFGRNFSPGAQVVLQAGDGSTYSLPLERDTPSMRIARVPASLSPGTYYVWVGGTAWDATSSPSSLIEVVASAHPSMKISECNGLIDDGVTDNSAALQSCLDAAASTADSSTIVSVHVKSGSYVINTGLSMHPYEVLSGDGNTDTLLLGKNPGSALSALSSPWLTLPQHAALVNIAITAADNRPLIASSDCSGKPDLSGDVYLYGSTFQTTVSGIQAPSNMVSLCGPDIQIYGSFFQGVGTNSLMDLNVSYGDGVLASGNQFDVSMGSSRYSGSQNLDIEDNDYSYITPLGGANGNGAIDVDRPFDAWGPSKMTANAYIGFNLFHDMGSTSNITVITQDGGGASYYGPVSSSTTNTVTLAEDPNWEWTGVTNASTIDALIVSGTGAGQHSALSAVNGRTITVATPWIIQPDATSLIEIICVQHNMTIANNSFLNTRNIAIEGGNTFDAQTEDNSLENAGAGIIYRAIGPYGGPAAFGPVLNATMLRNHLSVGRGDLIVESENANKGGIGISNCYGTVVVGSVIRGNTVPSSQTLFWTNNFIGTSGVLVEQNNALWWSKDIPPGYLVQNNELAP